MDWLTTDDNRLLNLEQERDDATDLEALRAALAAQPLPDGTDNPIALLEKRRLGLDIRLDALAKKQRELVGRLEKWYAKAIESNRDARRLRSLLLPLGEVCQARPDTLTWPLDADVQGTLPAVRLKLGLAGKAQASVAACAQLPDQAGEPPAGNVVVRMGVTGALKAEAGADLPVGQFLLAAGATARAAFACDYFSLHAVNMRLAPAVAAAMGRMTTSPFDLESVASRFRVGELQCITLNGNGSIGLAGQIALAAPARLGSVSLASLAYGYDATLAGEFDYLIRPDPVLPDSVVLRLRRRRDSADGRRMGIEVGLDMAGTYRRIRAETLPVLGQAQDLLGELDTWLTPADLLRERLQAMVDGLDDADTEVLAPLLAGLFGGRPGQGVTRALCRLLAETAGVDTDGWANRAAARADVLLDGLFDQLSLSEDQCAAIRARLAAKIAGILADLGKRADAKLRSVAEQKSAETLAAALDAVGLAASGLDDVEARLAALRRLVAGYRGMAARLYAALETATELKIGASLERRIGEEDARMADVTLCLDARQPAARRAYVHALTGDFDSALAVARTPGEGVEVRDCALVRVLKESEARGLDVAVLGFTLAGGSLVAGDTRVDVDSGGNVAVQSEASFARRRALLGEYKTLRFVDAFALSAAKRTRSLALELTLSYEDDRLEMREAEGFFASLVNAGLLSRDSAGKALHYLDERDRHAPASNQAGRLDVGLALDGAALEQLLDNADPLGYREGVLAVATRELASAYLAGQPSGTTEAHVLDALRANYNPQAGLADTIRQGLGPAKAGMTDDLIAYGHARAVDSLHALCGGITDALVAMRVLYGTAPETLATWSAETWQDTQNAIMLKAGRGLPGDFPSLFGREKVRPRTLALFRILGVLAGRLPAPAGTDVVFVNMTLAADAGGRKVRITG